MAKRDLSGAVNFRYLEDYAAGDFQLVDEVLGLFREQARIWMPLLDPSADGWKDAVHTIKGTARAVGAFDLGDVCQVCENEGPHRLTAVRDALDLALQDVAAYAHERALNFLKGKV
ncbi:MAG: Hpt domain-containing protein [Phenylobacterium zucineum]|nr:MAG: Hpt domain-containing protein [Phenylobacterium zucineum]